MIISEALPRVARPERISIRTRMSTSDHNRPITPRKWRYSSLGEWDQPIPLIEIQGTSNPDCRCLIPVGESTTGVIGSILKNARMIPVSGDDATYFLIEDSLQG